MTKRKSKTTEIINNFKMDKDVYALRKQVMNLIYEVKNLVPNLPRIDVRIGEATAKHFGTLGVARLNQNIIWITKDAINKGTDFLRMTVLHELVHTVYGFGHDEECPLMESYAKHVLPKKYALKIFMKYHSKFSFKIS